jgi:signal transduction histidine kinase/ligand-binding sensor domain-containing protein
MSHASWTASDGAPQGVQALALAPDGTLWIGAIGGLYHFDGRTFTSVQSSVGQPEMPAEPVWSVLVTRDGTVWAGFYRSGVVRIARGRVSRFDMVAGRQVRTVQDLREARDGSVWAYGDGQVLMRFSRGDTAWHQEAKPPDAAGWVDRAYPKGLINGLYIDASDVLWLSQNGRLFRRQLPGDTYTLSGVKAGVTHAFSETPTGDVWMSDHDRRANLGRTQRFDRQGRPLVTLTHPNVARALLHTPEGALLVSVEGRKLYRFHADSLVGQTTLPVGSEVDSYGGAVGPTDQSPAALLLDSDRNIWAGGRRGLGRFRTPRLVPFLADSTAGEWDICATPRGEVFLASAAVFSVRGGVTRKIPGSEGIRSVSCGADGVARAWKGGRLFEVREGGLRPLASIPGAPPMAIRRLVALPDHTLYAFAYSFPEGLGLWRFRSGEWTRLGGRYVQHAEDGSYVDTQGRLWVGYNFGRAGLPLEGRLYSSGTPGLHHVAAILETRHGHFAAGLNGLAVLRDTTFQMLRFADRAPTRGVVGLLESRDGDLWLNAQQGIVRVPAAELTAAVADPRYPMKTERITEGDFTGPARLSGTRSYVARATDGTLWFSMLNGVVSYDPDAPRVDKPPVVSIRSITADRVPLGARRTFETQPRTLAIEYFGVHLTAPDRVRYRYKLDGFDDVWQDAGARTEAIYTRPGPGTYTFRVMAANESGVWTAPAATAPFTVLPSFHQTRWFAALAAGAVLTLVWLAYTLRVRAVTTLVRARAEARFEAMLAERTRVARELHDTLLSGAAGIAMRLDALATRAASPAGVDAAALAELREQARHTLVDARRAVVAMRASGDALVPVSAQLADAARRVFAGTGVDARVSSTGAPCRYPAEVEEQAVRIATEAMTNAHKHAGCRAVRVTCAYRPRELCVSVRDDGRGFDPARAGANGHFGLVGMRERAAAVGAQLTVESAPGEGTTVRLEVPTRPTA